LAERFRFNCPSPFSNDEELVCGEILPDLHLARWPPNLERIDLGDTAEPKVEIERNLCPESICDLDEVTVGDPAGTQLHGGAERVRLRTDSREPNAREMPWGRSILEHAETLSGQQHQVEIAIAVDVDGRNCTTVIVVVEAKDVGALDEPAMRVVEKALSFISTERPAKIPCLVRDHILEGCFLLDGPCVGDSLPP